MAMVISGAHGSGNSSALTIPAPSHKDRATGCRIVAHTHSLNPGSLGRLGIVFLLSLIGCFAVRG